MRRISHGSPDWKRGMKLLLIAVCDDMPVECANIARQIETILKQSDTDFVIKKILWRAGADTKQGKL